MAKNGLKISDDYPTILYVDINTLTNKKGNSIC